MATIVNEVLHGYLESFDKFERSRIEIPWLREMRRSAFGEFCEIGFPTTRDEDWRFTDVSAISRTKYNLARKHAVSTADIEPWLQSNASSQLVFVDGNYAPELSSVKIDPAEEFTFTGLSAALRSTPEEIEKHLGKYVGRHRDGFSALNSAFFEDGAYIHLPRGTTVAQAVYLLFVSTTDEDEEAPSLSNVRNLIVAEEDSHLSVVEEYVSLGKGSTLCNSVTELVAEDNVVLSHYRIEHEQANTFNISALHTQQGRSANVSSHSVLLGGALVRNTVHPVLTGEGGECLVNGLFLGEGKQHIDNYMLVEHASPHCGSRQFYNGILDDHAHGVFHGRIIVHKDAQKTDAKQTNRNLLLSDDAQIDTKPQLEIYADDVKCTHGATIGQIDEEALFYLRSRGIGEVDARILLLEAFAGECLERMHEAPIKEYVEALVNQHMLRIANARRASRTRQLKPSPVGELA